MGLLISASDIVADGQYRLFDCRSHLGDLTRGQRDFAAGHIPGALHADMDLHLSSAPGKQGRHPLPERNKLAAQLRAWGVNNDTRIVCYDQNSGAFAARLWWLVRWLGHEAVFVLDGGLDAWRAQGGESETGTQVFPEGDFAAGPSLTSICEIDQVMDASHTLLDARDGPRFRGEVEPIDPVAGHIPGAISVPFSGNLTEGRFNTAEQLRQRFAALPLAEDARTVCYCGSGVTAIHNILAMMIAGYPEPALYPGSWSEWIADPDRPVATGPV